MEAPKQTSSRRIRGFIRRNSKTILRAVAIVVVLMFTAIVFYNAGSKQALNSKGSKQALTASLLDKFKNSAKKAGEKPKSTTPKPTSAANSSGFFRLSGIIGSNNSKTISIKLGNGEVIALTVDEKAKFYTGTPRVAKPISDLKVGASAFVIGTIGATGTFNASNIQEQK